MTCTAGVRPFRPVNDVEVRCELEDGTHEFHKGKLRDYAEPGSVTSIEWADVDRRSFHGEWPGACRRAEQLIACILPDLHRGRCVE